MTMLDLNGRPTTVDAEPGTPLLWVLRDDLGLTGTKFACGAALCGACTVHLDGVAIRSCVTPIESVTGRRVTTIEGATDRVAREVRKAWVELDVAQCGFCQPGQVMAASALLATLARPTDSQIDEAMSGNLCRCGAYPRIRAAVRLAAERLQST
ncbi:MAG: hypothetical protein RIS35_3625 [Pseudomonadota bacterium]|jgi:isoquinoline 1-oxidoreductase alpha subunit